MVSFWCQLTLFKQCVENSGLDHNEYIKCYTSELGTLLQLEAALKTNKLATPETGMIAGVPTVVYNDVIIPKSLDFFSFNLIYFN